MFCTKCGNDILDGSKFCTKCGALVDNTPTAAPAETEPASDKAAEGISAAGAAPSKKKRTGLVVGVAAAVVAAQTAGESADPYALVYIHDGAFLGGIDAPPKLVQYPNSSIYWL